jgi:hypothetical protein
MKGLTRRASAGVAGMVGLLMLLVSGCGGWEVSRLPAPSPSSTGDPPFVYDIYTEGRSLDQLRSVEEILARSVASRGRVNKRLHLEACRRLDAAVSHAGGWDWGGLPISELGWASFHCYSDPREALLHLRKSMSALEERGVTPEPATESMP